MYAKGASGRRRTVWRCSLSICASICDAKTYENYTLYRGIPVSNSHLNFFRNLSDLYGVNYWSLPGKIEMPVDFVIAPAQKKSRQMDTFDWQNYYKIDDIYKWLKDLAMAFPNEVVIESIGKTYENRDILAVKICLRGSLHRSKVIIEGGIHAREWISPAFVTYMINRIVHSKKSPDKKLRTIANTYEWYFVPVVNPDGYEYTHTKSEDLEYYLSFHSYGQFIIIPYAFSKTHAENYDETQEMGLRAAYKIRSFNNKSYAVGTAYDTV
ncbi:putative carboxypeptidase A-like protein, partial [Operophtera brumata]